MLLDEPSRQTLEGIPARVLTFLIGVGESPTIRAALLAKGYDTAEHDYAWSRLARLSTLSGRVSPTIDGPVRDAVIELDAWDNKNFPAIQATLSRLHPAQAAFVFNDLAPKDGPESVIAVATLLDRLDALENSPDRAATRTEDHAALATLATRGYTAEERARLRQLIVATKTVFDVAPVGGEEREQVLRELYAWHTDWATTARLLVSRRADRIRLGIAKRRKKTDDAEEGDDTEDATEADEATAAKASEASSPKAGTTSSSVAAASTGNGAPAKAPIASTT